MNTPKTRGEWSNLRKPIVRAINIAHETFDPDRDRNEEALSANLAQSLKNDIKFQDWDWERIVRFARALAPLLVDLFGLRDPSTILALTSGELPPPETAGQTADPPPQTPPLPAGQTADQTSDQAEDPVQKALRDAEQNTNSEKGAGTEGGDAGNQNAPQ